MLRRPVTYQTSQREEGTKGNVLVVHQVLFRQRQRVHDGVGFVNGLHIKKKTTPLPSPLEYHWRILPSRYSFTVARISAGITFMIC